MREQLAQTDLTQTQLERELDARVKYLGIINSEQFYLTIDTTKKLMQFRIGRNVVRECPVTIGATSTIRATDGRKWTFIPAMGGFGITGKETDYGWPVPDWFYAMRNEPSPAQRPVIANGLGKYVIVLQSNYIIHSPPPPNSPLQGPKPGSFMVPEADLGAMWPRITKDMRVYIF